MHVPIRSESLAPVDRWPALLEVRQHFPGTPLRDIAAATRDALAQLRLAERVKPGMRIAITAGSRGVLHMPAILAEAAAAVRALGAEPWIVPAMGSHGGATVAGQRQVLAGYGITEESVGAPVISQPDVVEIGATASGIPLFCDRLVLASDGVLVVNRVKPHTDFHGVIESGPTKMLAIGLGKWHSAVACHRRFITRGYEPVLREVGDALWAKLPLLGGLAPIENGHHTTVALGAVRPESHEADEAALLDQARACSGDLPFDRLDVLLVDRLGKDVSGTGMDPTVTGNSPVKHHSHPSRPFIWRIVVRGLTEATHGNATGVGQADFITQRCYDAIDWQATGVNVITAASVEGARCPLVCRDDHDLLRAAFQTSGDAAAVDKRFVWIRDTLSLDRFWASEALRGELEAHARCELTGRTAELRFDGDGAVVEL